MKEIIVLPSTQQDTLKEYMPNDNTLKKLANFFSMFSITGIAPTSKANCTDSSMRTKL